MSISIKNRVFGSDVPTILKKKIEARQLLAYKERKPIDGNYVLPGVSFLNS